MRGGKGRLDLVEDKILKERKKMKQYLSSLRNIAYAILLTIGLTILSFVTFFALFISIDLIFFNNGKYAKYDWDFILSLVISIVLVSLIYRKQAKKHREEGNLNAIITWNISFTVVAIGSFLILASMSFKGIKQYINRDKNPKITTLSELLEHSGELAGKTIKLSDEMFDSTLLIQDVNTITDNVNLHWKEVHSDDGNFSIEFPNYDVKKEVKTQLVSGGEHKIHSLTLNAEDKLDVNVGYSVTYFYEPSVKSVDKFFEEQKKSLLSRINGTLEAEYIIDSLGYECRELYVTIDNRDIKATSRFIYRRNNFYQITVLTREGNLFNKGIYHFINSFKFQ